jgi:hypothetical protein
MFGTSFSDENILKPNFMPCGAVKIPNFMGTKFSSENARMFMTI